jgi:hypothetical protein
LPDKHLSLVSRLARPIVSSIDFEEHQALLNSLKHVVEKKAEGCTIYAGLTVAGRLVVSVATMTGFEVISAP